jgi:phenylalanyl-tRNA synthetase beta chain
VIEEALLGAGFSEAYTPTLVSAGSDAGALALPEPMTEEQALLRRTLVPSLVEAVERNVAAGNEEIALFEIARVFLPVDGGRLPDERERVAGVVAGGFGRAKGAVETVYEAIRAKRRFERATEPFLHPGKAARTQEGWVGELHPSLLAGAWGAFELDLRELVAAAAEAPQYEDVVTYPPVKQDLAFAVDESVAAGELVDAAREAAAPELSEMTPFDVYRGAQVGEGRKSIAFRVEFRSPQRTLTDEEAAQLREKIVRALKARFGAELRA